MEIHRLVKMANEIGGFFEQIPDHREAVNSIAAHLRNFWEPRMRSEIIAYARLGDGDLKPIVREAILTLEANAETCIDLIIFAVPPSAQVLSLSERAHENVSESVKEFEALRWRAGAVSRDPDRLAVEEPLEIRLAGRRFTLTMRTPGHDRELAAGFLLAEGFVGSSDELGEIRPVLGPRGEPEPNAIDVLLAVPAERLRERLKRNFVMSSSCGVCGKTSIEAIERRIARIEDKVRISARTILKLPATMREAQAVFSATGGLHAAALFTLPAADGSSNGDAQSAYADGPARGCRASQRC